jgi:GT2 family glycosyltransferase
VTPAAFAPGDARVTAVLVTHGAWNWTRRALRALRAHSEGLEIVVVDNASPDRTPERIGNEFPDVEVVRNADNRGFAPAANEGAERAQGEFVAFLNSDTLVHDGWLPPLVDALDADSRLGAAVPCLLNLDGTLQEAGALVARDGSTWSYGAGDDPSRPEYRFPRVVDYGAAACLLVRRGPFLARGGFAETYSPAYYEDVDACFALADDGLLTVYQPGSVATHARYGSGSAGRARELSRRNRRTFLASWGDRLEARPSTLEPPRPRAVIGARDARALDRLLLVGDDARVDGLLVALRGLWPRARISALLDSAGPGSRRSARLLALGVEAAAGVADVDAWLGERRFHYDAVIVADGAAAPIRTQPQALVLALAGVLDRDGAPLAGPELGAVLAEAGLAPPPGVDA